MSRQQIPDITMGAIMLDAVAFRVNEEIRHACLDVIKLNPSATWASTVGYLYDDGVGRTIDQKLSPTDPNATEYFIAAFRSNPLTAVPWLAYNTERHLAYKFVAAKREDTEVKVSFQENVVPKIQDMWSTPGTLLNCRHNMDKLMGDVIPPSATEEEAREAAQPMYDIMDRIIMQERPPAIEDFRAMYKQVISASVGAEAYRIFPIEIGDSLKKSN